jgi:hypothetical protein
MGKELEAPRDAPIIEFMEWLVNELAAMNGHMTVG